MYNSKWWNYLKNITTSFALSDLELGCTSKIKHEIKLDNENTISKICYHHIPPHQFEEVWKHLQDMLDIVAIRSCCSPWKSAIVLVWKKDGSLRFCIDLRHLNSHTIKDAYSLTEDWRIPGLFEWCMHLHVTWFEKWVLAGWNGWEKHTIHMAFTVGPLGFYKCICMPFRLTNAPATFQRLMESVPWGITSPILHYLFGWYHYFLQNSWGTFTSD